MLHVRTAVCYQRAHCEGSNILGCDTVAGQTVADVQKDGSAFVFRTKQSITSRLLRIGRFQAQTYVPEIGHHSAVICAFCSSSEQVLRQ